MDVTLRAWVPDDASVLSALFDDPLVYRFTPIQPPFELEAAGRRIEIARRGEPAGSICCRAVVEGDEAVGEVAAYRRAPQPGDVVAGVSYVIGAAHRGRGLAVAATARFLDEVRELWSVTRFVAEIAPENPASHVVAARLGFVEEVGATPTPRAGKDYSTVPWTLVIGEGRR